MAKIAKITAQIIKDSRGEDTVLATVFTDENISESDSVPMGKSRGKFEAFCVSAEEAVKNITEKISPVLVGLDPENQSEIDRAMLKLDGTLNKENLGGNSTLAVSLACARLGAKTQDIPLWKHIQKIAEAENTNNSPRLLMNLINGGLHAENNLDFQEYLVIPKGGNAKESFEIGQQIYDSLIQKYPEAPLGNEGGIAPSFNDNSEPIELLKQTAEMLGLKEKIDLGIDAASSNIENSKLDSLNKYTLGLAQKGDLVYLEDPRPEEDFQGFANIKNTVNKNLILSGDDLTVTNTQRIEKAHEQNSISGIIIKPNQIGTLTETIEAIKKAQDYGWAVIVSHRSGETEDNFIADLAFGVGAWGLKAGAPGPKERILKYKRLIEIEEKEV